MFADQDLVFLSVNRKVGVPLPTNRHATGTSYDATSKWAAATLPRPRATPHHYTDAAAVTLLATRLRSALNRSAAVSTLLLVRAAATDVMASRSA